MSYVHTLSRYFSDLYGWDTFNIGHSFVSYSMENEKLMICEFYVPEESRKQGIAKKLINIVIGIAERNLCKEMYAKVELKKNGHFTVNPSLSLKVILGHGFIPYGAHNDEIYLVRKLKKYN